MLRVFPTILPLQSAYPDPWFALDCIPELINPFEIVDEYVVIHFHAMLTGLSIPPRLVDGFGGSYVGLIRDQDNAWMI